MSDLSLFASVPRGLESMLAGAIPVTCPVGAIPDVMTDRRHGLFVPDRDPDALADAIAWIDGHRDAAWAIAHPLSIETRASRSQLTLT